MTKKTGLNRRELMAGAALAATAATAACAAAQTGAAETKSLAGKSVLITGCSSGFGRMGAEFYARLGAKVFATMRNLPRVEATELAALAEADGLDIEIIELDVTSDESVTAAVATALASAGGKIDVLVIMQEFQHPARLKCRICKRPSSCSKPMCSGPSG